jgi:hypothetical protein
MLNLPCRYEFLLDNADALDTNLKLIPPFDPSMSRKEGLETLHGYLELLVGLLRWYPNRYAISFSGQGQESSAAE